MYAFLQNFKDCLCFVTLLFYIFHDHFSLFMRYVFFRTASSTACFLQAFVIMYVNHAFRSYNCLTIIYNIMKYCGGMCFMAILPFR